MDNKGEVLTSDTKELNIIATEIKRVPHESAFQLLLSTESKKTLPMKFLTMKRLQIVQDQRFTQRKQHNGPIQEKKVRSESY